MDSVSIHHGLYLQGRKLLQGPAFTDILEGTYYAAASLFSKPRPDKPASVRFNFGPDFKFGPPAVEGLPAARPFCEVPPKPPPIPEEDGTVTVDKTIVAKVKAPEDEPEAKPAGQRRAPAAPVEMKSDPGAKPAMQKEPHSTVPTGKQAKLNNEQFQLDPGLLATLAGAPSGVWESQSGAMPPAVAASGPPAGSVHAANPTPAGPMTTAAVAPAFGTGNPVVGGDAVVGGPGRPNVPAHSVAAAPRRHSTAFERG